MKKIFVLILILILSHCSFDNKTGIWQNNTKVANKNEKFKNFKTLSAQEKLFDTIIEPSKNLNISFKPIKTNLVWLNKNYNNLNNLDNFSYKNLNKIIFKSKKLSNGTINGNILFDGDKIIITNDKGDIIVYSISSKSITLKFNFYKKKFKNIQKKLNIILEKEVIFVSDNIGYLYALDYKKNQLLWAKNYKIPFRSNLKIIENKKLGTAGPLSLLNLKNDKSIVCINGDIYTNLKFKSLLDFHEKNKNFCTVCTRDYNFNIPYGVINRGKEIINEKPEISKKISAGIYVFDKKALKLLTKNKYIDMNDFINSLYKRKKKIGLFHIYELVFDIGDVKTYEDVNMYLSKQ